ncbi:MAG: hypothetical protein HWE27_00800 [Gammaproteobacteria bacterium]|nr:hypothetical protein [Gammaproteobacteria bacterium]
MASLSVLILTRSMAGKELLTVVRGRHDSMNIDCHTLTFNPEATDQIVFPHVAGRIKRIDKGCGVVVLTETDITHSSLFDKLSKDLKVSVVTGLNDAMLEAIRDCESMNINQAAEYLAESAKQGIKSYMSESYAQS